MQVYHGSNLAIEQPRILPSNRDLDFGPGFFTTTNRAQAESFAERVVRREGGGIATVSVYDIDEELIANDLSVSRFSGPDGEWLDFVAANRTATYTGKQYDLVSGPVANDDVFLTITLYLSNVLSREQTLEALKVKRLFDQYVWKSAFSLEAISFAESYTVNGGDRGRE